MQNELTADRVNSFLKRLGSDHRVKDGDEIYEGLISAFEAIATRLEALDEHCARPTNDIPGSSFS